MGYKEPLTSTTDWGVARVDGTSITATNGIISINAVPPASLNFGFFYDTTTQTNPVVSTPNPATFNTIGSSNQVTVVGGTQITPVNAGTYNIVFTVSLEKTTGGAPTITSIWLRYNGVDISNSRQDIATPNQTSLLFVTGSYTQAMAAGSNIELVWSSPDIDVQFSFLPATVGPIRPATPSAKMTLTRIS
jgi:hypothetical protein